MHVDYPYLTAFFFNLYFDDSHLLQKSSYKPQGTNEAILILTPERWPSVFWQIHLLAVE